MTISYNWLREYLPEDRHISPEELSGILTAIGLEVESLERRQSLPGGLEGLVVGKVEEVKNHPNADKLHLTRVDIGENEPLKIVCGAPNVAGGQLVVVAPVGTTIYPSEGEPVKMKKAKIRGEESFGMICAEDEIGLGQGHEGILVLDHPAHPGMKASAYFQVEEDWIYEIGLTPNRMDAMSHLGVAMDVCAKLSYDAGKHYHIRRPQVSDLELGRKDSAVKVSVKNTEACPRYAGLVLKNIEIKESPDWIKKRLESVGVRPINNVVDITNYVLQECGQPLHAFDLSAIKGEEIRVANLPDGTPFITLDGVERKLRSQDLMICNKEEGMCIAGVFGGLDSGVKEGTTAIFLESACFNAVSIRRTSLYHNLRTDAAVHFEKGVDISGVLFALKRAAGLMVDLCGATIESNLIDCYPNPEEKTEITLKGEYLRRLSGKGFTLDQAEAILSDLGFEIRETTPEYLRVAVPFSKPDMDVPADLVEEIMRIDGYDQVAIPTHLRISPSASEDKEAERLNEKIADYLSNSGFYEIMTNSITNSKYYGTEKGLIRLLNSLTSELDVLRPSMLETGLEVVAYNLNRKQEDLSIFESGKIYSESDPAGSPRLALWLTGHKSLKSWSGKAAKVDPFFIKGYLINLFTRLGISKSQINFSPVRENELTDAIEIYINRDLAGKLGNVVRGRLQLFGIKQEVWFVEIDLAVVLKIVKSQKKISYKAIPKFPSVQRDLSLVLDKKISYADLKDIVKKNKPRILEEVNLFDVFEGEKLGQDKKAYAVSLTFRNPEKTLTDKEIDKEMNKLIRSFEQSLGAEIRS